MVTIDTWLSVHWNWGGVSGRGFEGDVFHFVKYKEIWTAFDEL